jgi:hypothetical protein
MLNSAGASLDDEPGVLYQGGSVLEKVKVGDKIKFGDD